MINFNSDGNFSRCLVSCNRYFWIETCRTRVITLSLADISNRRSKRNPRGTMRILKHLIGRKKSIMANAKNCK